RLDGVRRTARRWRPMTISRTRHGLSTHSRPRRLQADSAHSRPEHASDLADDALAEDEHLAVVRLVLADRLLSGADLAVDPGSLHEYELAARAKQGSGDRDERAEGTHGSGG